MTVGVGLPGVAEVGVVPELGESVWPGIVGWSVSTLATVVGANVGTSVEGVEVPCCREDGDSVAASMFADGDGVPKDDGGLVGESAVAVAGLGVTPLCPKGASVGVLVAC